MARIKILVMLVRFKEKCDDIYVKFPRSVKKTELGADGIFHKAHWVIMCNKLNVGGESTQRPNHRTCK